MITTMKILKMMNVMLIYHLFLVRSPYRKTLEKTLEKNNIGYLIHYPKSPHLKKAYVNLKLKKNFLPIAEELDGQIISFPLNVSMSLKYIDILCSLINLGLKNKNGY
jgi:dTDP-4-amino-4,6-dideoxygalactose transaminase